MLTFTLIVLGLFVIGLLIAVCSLSSKIEDMESDSLFSPVCRDYSSDINRLNKTISEIHDVNAQVFTLIEKELGKQFKKTRIVINEGYGEKIVTKFELVDLPKVKKNK